MSALILASPGERVKLLRAGITGKQIEVLFVELNNFKIVGAVLFCAGSRGREHSALRGLR